MQNYHILVCEDEIEIGNAVEIYLKNQGYRYFGLITVSRDWKSSVPRPFIWR